MLMPSCQFVLWRCSLKPCMEHPFFFSDVMLFCWVFYNLYSYFKLWTYTYSSNIYLGWNVFSFPAKWNLFTSVTCPFLQFLPLLVIYMHWKLFFRKDDGVKVVSVENLKNPYEKQENFNMRFKLTLNKLYAWSLVSYERVVMLDSDNIFLQNTDELFQCGQFCAVFINPCIFHTGLFVLQVELLTLQAFHFLQKI